MQGLFRLTGAATALLAGVTVNLVLGCATAPVSTAASHVTSESARLGDILRQRVMPPHEITIATYMEAGAEYARPHTVSDGEWALIERAIADLPPLYQRVLGQRLARLSFIDAPSSTGTALTRTFKDADGRTMFDITFRTDVLDRSLTDFLTGKEAILFSPDGSGYSVHILAGETSALTYLLLHEATHIVDNALGLVSDDRLFSDIWRDYRGLAETYAAGPIGRSVYRRGAKIPLAQSPALYAALAESPFVSLYATASAGEDVAELAAWSELSRRFDIPLKIQVRDATGQPVITVEPLKSTAVQSRFRILDELLKRSDAGAIP